MSSLSSKASRENDVQVIHAKPVKARHTGIDGSDQIRRLTANPVAPSLLESTYLHGSLSQSVIFAIIGAHRSTGNPRLAEPACWS